MINIDAKAFAWDHGYIQRGPNRVGELKTPVAVYLKVGSQFVLTHSVSLVYGERRKLFGKCDCLLLGERPP